MLKEKQKSEKLRIKDKEEKNSGNAEVVIILDLVWRCPVQFFNRIGLFSSVPCAVFRVLYIILREHHVVLQSKSLIVLF